MRIPDLTGPLAFPANDSWIQWVERWGLIFLIGISIVGVFVIVGGIDSMFGSGGGDFEFNVIDIIVSFLAH